MTCMTCCRSPVYLYETPSSIGTSPHPCHWHRMIQMYGHKFGEAGLTCHTWDTSAFRDTLDTSDLRHVTLQRHIRHVGNETRHT